jgi:hypothetical protein
MEIKRRKPEETVTKLRQVEVLCGQGIPRIDAIHQVQIWLSPDRSFAQRRRMACER